uniref:hypothetical protein n=1 Tax=Streptomyces sp. FR1 TaxID=349971 RepID=UPI001564E2D1|nr:hypothetical protein [Streptomyces sp. FR1]
MSDLEFTTEDMAAMGREGTRRTFLRMVRRPSAGPVRATSVVSGSMPADHIPGAWPAGVTGLGFGARVCACAECAKHAQGRPLSETSETE